MLKLHAPAGLTDLLAEFYQFHLCWHVSHSPHTLPKVLAADEPILVFVKLLEGLTQLCREKKDERTKETKREIQLFKSIMIRMTQIKEEVTSRKLDHFCCRHWLKAT